MDNQGQQLPPAPMNKQPQAQAAEVGKPMKISITLPTNAYFVSGIRDFTLGLIRNMTEFSEQWAFRFQSVVDELCNNAIEHGSKEGEDIIITFTNYPGESLEISVEDSGTGDPKVQAGDLQRIVDERRDPNYVHSGIRGRGLSKIVAEWTDELKFEDTEKGGIRVTIKKFLRDPNLPSASANSLEQPTHVVL